MAHHGQHIWPFHYTRVVLAWVMLHALQTCCLAAPYMPPLVKTLLPTGLIGRQNAARRRLNETNQFLDITDTLSTPPGTAIPRRLQHTPSPVDQSGRRMMIVTASNFFPCNAGIGNWMQLLTLRNKEDYARIHGYGLHWSINQFGARIRGPWNKVAALLYLAETLDEDRYQWLLWVDTDAIFANMTTVIPFDKYEGHDIIMWCTPDGMFEPDAKMLNSGVVLLRISNWSRIFLRELLKLGVDWRHGSPNQQLLMENVKNYEDGLYEQNGIVWLFKNHPEWRSKIYPEQWEDYIFHSLYNMVPYQDQPNPKPALVVHWAGCQLCSPMYIAVNNDYQKCLRLFTEIWSAANTDAVRHFHVGVPVDPAALLKLLEHSTPEQWVDHRFQFE